MNELKKQAAFSDRSRLFRNIERTYKTGKKNYTRIFRDEPFVLKITFPEGVFPSRVVLNTNINQPNGKWGAIKFSREDACTFSLKLKINRSGIYCFRVKFILTGEKSWIWDPVPHSWLIADPPSMKNLKVYTLIPGITGNIENWVKELRRIKKMCFNTIHLLPVTKMDDSKSPYSAKDLFNIEPEFGISGDSRTIEEQWNFFVEELIRLNLKLSVDLVLNHVGINSKLANQHPEWFYPDPEESDGLKRAGWWKGQEWVAWEDLALIYYGHPHPGIRSKIWGTMTRYALMWAKFANKTGGMVRLDNFHSSDRGFINYVLGKLHEKFPELIVFAELFEDPDTVSEYTRVHGLNLLLATPWEEKFTPNLRNYIKFLHKKSDQLKYIIPITSHDSGSPAEEFGTPEATIPRYIISALYGMGATGIVQGVEHGFSRKLDFRGVPKKIKIKTDENYSDFIIQVNSFLDKHSIFWKSGNLEFIDKDHDAILGILRYSDSLKENDFIIFSNLDTNSSQKITLDCDLGRVSLFKKKLRNALSGKEIIVDDREFCFDLEPCGFRIWEVI